VIASADDGNVAANVLDNNFSTRWSASGDPQWIQFCLGNIVSVTGVQIAFYNGNLRSSSFDVLVSSNGTSFTNAATGLVSSGTSLALENFNFPAQNAKYVRIVGHGNSVNLWNSYTEVRINSSAAARAAQEIVSEEKSSPVVSSPYPNPANEQFTISYEVKKAGRVRLSIHNAVNNHSTILLDKELQAGSYQNTFDIRHLAKGLHVIKFMQAGEMKAQKIVKQ